MEVVSAWFGRLRQMPSIMQACLHLIASFFDADLKSSNILIGKQQRSRHMTWSSQNSHVWFADSHLRAKVSGKLWCQQMQLFPRMRLIRFLFVAPWHRLWADYCNPSIECAPKREDSRFFPDLLHLFCQSGVNLDRMSYVFPLIFLNSNDLNFLAYNAWREHAISRSGVADGFCGAKQGCRRLCLWHSGCWRWHLSIDFFQSWRL